MLVAVALLFLKYRNFPQQGEACSAEIEMVIVFWCCGRDSHRICTLNRYLVTFHGENGSVGLLFDEVGLAFLKVICPGPVVFREVDADGILLLIWAIEDGVLLLKKIEFFLLCLLEDKIAVLFLKAGIF